MRWTSDGKLAEYFVLESSGNAFYANNQVLGVDPDANCVYYGADGSVGSRDEFSPAERKELADYMIALWARFKEPREAEN